MGKNKAFGRPRRPKALSVYGLRQGESDCLFDSGGNLIGKSLHLGRFHLDVMAEIQVAGVVERHQVDMRVWHIDADHSNTDFDAGAYLLEAFSHLATEAVQLDEEVVVEVEDIVDFLLGNA